MSEKPTIPAKNESSFAREIGAKAERKIAARHSNQGVWFGLGMMGLIGWSVTIPMLLGVGLGLWLDKHHPGTRNWTLALLVAGLAVGCLNAGYWVVKEDQAMQEQPEDNNE